MVTANATLALEESLVTKVFALFCAIKEEIISMGNAYAALDGKGKNVNLRTTNVIID